jgi:hypothetical protein
LPRKRGNIARVSRQTGTCGGRGDCSGADELGWQQDGALHATEEQHRRNVLAVYANAEVQAQFGAVSGFDGADHLAAPDHIADVQR